MAAFDMLSRYVRKLIFSTESIILFCFIFVIYNYLFNADNVWDLVEKIKVKIELRIRGDYDNVTPMLDNNLLQQQNQVFWEFSKGDARVYAIQGRRTHMEDRFNIVNDIEHTDTSLYGVFDGHGGDFAADFTEKTLFKSIMIQIMKSHLNGDKDLNMSQILNETILSVDEKLLNVCRENNEISGTTALVAALRGSTLSVANVGDSRGVMCDRHGNAVPLSYDHKPHHLAERRRIRRAGGFVAFNGVWRVAGVLATSRALGDLPLKANQLVIAEPDVLTFDLDAVRPRFLVMATDGLWDVFSNSEAVQLVAAHLSEPHFGARTLALQAYARGSLDNITVMVVRLDSPPVAAQRARDGTAQTGSGHVTAQPRLVAGT